jgi:hypothetical protein
VEQASGTTGAFTDIESTELVTVWRGTQPAPSVKGVYGQRLGFLAEIEADTKAVLNILLSCR